MRFGYFTLSDNHYPNNPRTGCSSAFNVGRRLTRSRRPGTVSPTTFLREQDPLLPLEANA
jgi:hypothetical protein